MIIRGQPRNGPPPERTLALAEVECPRMARRPGQTPVSDEPWAWESREFLRKLLVGKSVLATVTHKMATEAPVKQYFTGIIKQVSEIFLLIKLSV